MYYNTRVVKTMRYWGMEEQGDKREHTPDVFLYTYRQLMSFKCQELIFSTWPLPHNTHKNLFQIYFRAKFKRQNIQVSKKYKYVGVEEDFLNRSQCTYP